jgi:2-iminobutanoate/2-iminopropanoate deaminase
MKETIHAPDAPAAVGPYSQGVLTGNFLFCSGQIPIDPKTGELIAGSVADQTRKVLENLTAVLRAKSLTLDHVVKTTVFLTDLGKFQEMNAVYAEFFREPFPARSTIQVAGLPKGASVEIEAIVAVP